MNLDKIRVILVETSHPGNIGSSARAMKIMGLENLILVNPKVFPDPKANELASHADDILENAVVVGTLDEALEGCTLVIGMSARDRIMPQTVLTPRIAAEKIVEEYETHKNIALVFGRENSGLKNHELERCPFQVKIPAMSDYSSLNLAAAVQVIAYEIYSASLEDAIQNEGQIELATADEMAKLYQNIEETMAEIGFLKPNNPRRMMPRIRQIFNRARLDREDVNLFRGMMVAIVNFRKKPEE